ncbi:uncharacterized protein H6S33_006507 [Morchella sextelata]|uniref:uncharacterized protein n=1 Tax=Morchella sextelata TaxID=1174677 RepID=UPI001D042F12|nr:uncharacterized protein H6S33_006507 [Morchella sextelata]KAH0604839.1 hypothetical protein H6S33_006507 [Morchella sextelata]
MSDTKKLDVPISVEGLLALTWSLNLLVFVFMVLRLWMNRRQSLKTPSIIISDSLLVASFIIGIAAISTDAWKYNLELMGRTRVITPEENKIASLLSFICGYLVFSAMWLSKGACVIYYYHLFPNLSPYLRKYLFFVTAFTAGTYVFVIFLHSSWCRPIFTNWDGTCNATGNTTTLPLWSFLNIFTDIFILILPLSVLHTLQLGRRQLAGLVVVFFIGSLSIIAAIARFVDIYPKIRKDPNAPIVHTYELWACVEITMGQLVVCLPALRAYLRKTRDRKNASHYQTSSSLGRSKEAISAKSSVIRTPVGGSDGRYSETELVRSGREEC